MQELVKYQKLQQEMDEDARGHDRHMWELEAHHQQEVQKLKDEFEEQLRIERAECQTCARPRAGVQLSAGLLLRVSSWLAV